MTQAIARHMGNEFDDRFNKKLNSLNIKTELYQRYADDVDIVVRSVGRDVKFCPLAGNLQSKTAKEIHDEIATDEDVITMRELKKIADTMIENIETEYDCPSEHPELGFKVPVLDLAIWVEEVEVSSRGLDLQVLHSNCPEDETCLPIGAPRPSPAQLAISHYTPPVNRGRVEGRSTLITTSDNQLIEYSGSQDISLHSDGALSAPHPTPGSCGPGRVCRSRPCRCNIEQSQLAHLAPRTSQPRDQDVGLLPPATNADPSRGHPSNADPSGDQPSQPYAPPAHRGRGAGRSNVVNSNPDARLIQPSGSLTPTRTVQQVLFNFYSKPMAAKKVILSTSAQPWGQKRTTLTQELIRRLLNCSKELSCSEKRKHLDNFMQLLKNSGYDEKFRAEILNSGLKGYNKIVEAERDRIKPMYRPKGWNTTARWLAKRRKKKNWLGPFWKSAIFVPPTPGSELKKQMQAKEEEMRAGGREGYPIKIIETAGKTLEQTLVNTDPFDGNKCTDEKCEPNKNPANKINCRRNCVCYRITCLLCLAAGRQADVTHLESACYYGQTAKNMHCRSKEHVSKFNSKSEKIRSESAFYKHLMNTHGGKSDQKTFSDYFEIKILKAYQKPFTMLVEEGTFISNHKGELLNSKNEWHQAKIIRTTTNVIQGGADVLRRRGGGRDQEVGGGETGVQRPQGRAAAARPWGQ